LSQVRVPCLRLLLQFNDGPVQRGVQGGHEAATLLYASIRSLLTTKDRFSRRGSTPRSIEIRDEENCILVKYGSERRFHSFKTTRASRLDIKILISVFIARDGLTNAMSVSFRGKGIFKD